MSINQFTARTGDSSRAGLKRFLIALAGLALFANALFMLADPLGWYEAIEGVPDTGPFNPHFVRDIGVSFLTAALTTAAAARWLRLAWPLLCTVALYLGLHALLHLWDIAAGRLEPGHLLIDAPGVFLPLFAIAALALWVRRDHDI
ncbi:hypothetical protein [Parvibaculum sp.]|uniref:hypothetical protein n=1 Tax=Parvibaculum sp. TaxID=2024848 RepID=UPI00321060E8